MRKQRSVFKVIRQYKKKLRKMVRYEKSILFAVRYKELAVTFKREFFHRPRFDIIQKLKELADLSAINHRSYIKRRRKSYPVQGDCFACRKPATLHHHIILIANGGCDKPFNRIPLCESCHAYIHTWLPNPDFNRAIALQEKDMHSHLSSIRGDYALV